VAQARSKTRKRPRGREPVGLTHDAVRREALRLIDREGLEEFSTRKLGRALGCEAMAIYWYYPSKEALLDAVVDLLVSSIMPSLSTPRGGWVDALRRIAHAYRGIADAHPRAFPLLATRRFATAGTYAFLEQLFEMAHAQGIPDRTIARFFRAVAGYCSGVALDELAGARAAAGDREGDGDGAASFPRLAAVTRWLEPRYDEETFDFGLEILLEALARKAKTKRR
jgi:AcrR family transcriptional regulator